MQLMPQAVIKGQSRKWELKVGGRKGWRYSSKGQSSMLLVTININTLFKIFHEKCNSKWGILINSCFKTLMLRINELYI